MTEDNTQFSEPDRGKAPPLNGDSSTKPTPPPARIGLVLSGGGFRASFFHVGVLRYMRDAGLLERVVDVHAVSGGSVLDAQLSLNWKAFSEAAPLSEETRESLLHSFPTFNPHDQFDEQVARLVGFAQSDPRGNITRRLVWNLLRMLWPWGGGGVRWRDASLSTTALFASRLECLLGKTILSQIDLPAHSDGTRRGIYFLCTNLQSLGLCAFASRGEFLAEVDPSPIPYKCADFRLPLAVAASAAFPAFFTPVKVGQWNIAGWPRQGPAADQSFDLADGGVFDNLGLNGALAISPGLDAYIVSDASATEQWVTPTFPRILTSLFRTSDVLMSRVHQLEIQRLSAELERYAVDARAPELTVVDIDLNRRAVGVASAHTRPTPGAPAFASRPDPMESPQFKLSPATSLHIQPPASSDPQIRELLRYLRTDFDHFTDLEVRCLIAHGWNCARERLSGMVSRVAAVDARWNPGERPYDPFKDPESIGIAHATNHVRSGGKRRVGWFRASDAISYVNPAVVIALFAASLLGLVGVCLLFVNLILRDPVLHVQDWTLTAGGHASPPHSIELRTAELRTRAFRIRRGLADRLLERRGRGEHSSAGFFGEIESPESVETWSTATAIAGLAPARAEDATLLSDLALMFGRRFETSVPSPDVADDAGWTSTYMRPHAHAGATIWMLIAGSSLLSLAQMHSRATVEKDIELVREHLVPWTMKCIRKSGDDSWSPLAAGFWTTGPTDPYSTSLLLLCVCEMEQKGQEWIGDAIVRHACAASLRESLLASYGSGTKAGWSMPRKAGSVAVESLGLSLQVYSSLLYADFVFSGKTQHWAPCPPALLGSLEALLIEARDTLDRPESHRILLPSGKDGKALMFTVRPWALMAAWLRTTELLRQAKAEASSLERVLRQVEVLLVEGSVEGTQYTFQLSEYLYAVGKICDCVDKAH